MAFNDCKEFQKMIVPFDAGQLSLKDEEEFVKHIEKCDDCREEFEIHYIIEYALNEEQEFKVQEVKHTDKAYIDLLEKFDFKGVVDLKLQNSIVKTSNMRIFNDFVKFCFALSNVLILICTIVLFVVLYWG